MFRCHSETGRALKDDLFGPKVPAELLGGLEGLKDFIGRFEGSVILPLMLGNALFEPTRGWAGRLVSDELPYLGPYIRSPPEPPPAIYEPLKGR